MQGFRINFCETNVMSVCNAIENDMQKFCRFYKKSSCGHHCMFLHFNEYCDSLEAQKHARKIENHKPYGFAISDTKQVKNAEARLHL